MVKTDTEAILAESREAIVTLSRLITKLSVFTDQLEEQTRDTCASQEDRSAANGA